MGSRSKGCCDRKIVTRSNFEYNVPYGIRKMTVFDDIICTKLNDTLRYSIESSNIVDYWINLKTTFIEQEYFQID